MREHKVMKKTDLENKPSLNGTRLLSAVLTALFTMVQASALPMDVVSGGMEGIPNLDRSELVVIDGVGDILGDGGEVGITLRDTNGNVLEGVAVRLLITGGSATLASVNGVTDAQGRFSSLLFSKVMTVATVGAVVDTDGDGRVDTRMGQAPMVAFLDDVTLTNGVGINIDTPDDSAVLHVNATDRGVMIPRVALQGCSDRITILDPATSLLVFNTNPSNSLKVGYVYFNGTDWVNFLFD